MIQYPSAIRYSYKSRINGRGTGIGVHLLAPSIAQTLLILSQSANVVLPKIPHYEAYWTFDNTVADSSGNSHDFGFPTAIYSPVKFGNGLSGNITLTNQTIFPNNNPFNGTYTISAWFLTQTGNSASLKYSTTVGLLSDGTTITANVGSTTVSVPASGLNHVALVVESGLMSLYVNGEFVGSASIVAELGLFSNTQSIISNNVFPAAIDDAAIWPAYALTDVEIAKIYMHLGPLSELVA